MNLGMDFGSTYTIVSLYDENNKLLEALLLGGMTSPCIPTVAALKKGKLSFGVTAKNATGQINTRMFNGFKMLISENDRDELTRRGFDEEYTPIRLTKDFLENLIQMAQAKCGESQIDNLVIGAPEVWFQEMNTVSGRGTLRDICQQLPNVRPEGVKVVSEPSCAGAFFAYNYMVIKGKPFSGHILLVDYGGGTLDINLTSISAEPGPDGKQAMQIKVLESTGAGENTEGKIGQAGMRYMESVAERALIKNELWDPNDLPQPDGKFYRLVNQLEASIVSRTGEIRSQFIAYSGMDLEDLEEEEFDTLEYKDEEVIISYATLLEVYDEVIRDVLGSKLMEMKKFIKKHNIDTSDDEKFKIALVGGFGNYYLVRRQVDEIFENGSLDGSMRDIIQKEEDREKAISYGAALFASGIVGIRQTAPYSIALYQTGQDGNPEVNYAFRYRADIKYDIPYFPSYENGQPVIVFMASGGVKEFVINMGHEKETALRVPLREEFRGKLLGLITNQYKTAAIGFSLDSSEILRVHVHEYDLLKQKFTEKGKIIELAKFSELFDITAVRPVYSSK